MKITFLSLFPEFYDSFKNTSIIKKAILKNVVSIDTVNIRDFSCDKNKRVDDVTIGGGPGLIMKCDPIVKAINSVKTSNSKVIYISSRGTPYNQKKARELASGNEDLILLCGHYEGIDERVLDYVDEEISIGDYILTGGEVASLVVADSVIRLLEGSITEESHLFESYENGLLEYPQYTFPRDYNGKQVPDILFSGNHKAIDKWRKKESFRVTLNKRKDLFDSYKLSDEEKELVEEIKENRVGKWETDAIKKGNKIKVHDLKLLEKYFYLIKDNKKIYELRMNDEKRREIKVNDEIRFVKEPDQKECFYKGVKALHYFKDFKELSENIDVKLAGFGTKEELVEVMEKIYKDKLDKYNVVAIELK